MQQSTFCHHRIFLVVRFVDNASPRNFPRISLLPNTHNTTQSYWVNQPLQWRERKGKREKTYRGLHWGKASIKRRSRPSSSSPSRSLMPKRFWKRLIKIIQLNHCQIYRNSISEIMQICHIECFFPWISVFSILTFPELFNCRDLGFY